MQNESGCWFCKFQSSWQKEIHSKVATLLDDYFPDHVDCECSRCLAFIYGIKDLMIEKISQVETHAIERERNEKSWKDYNAGADDECQRIVEVVEGMFNNDTGMIEEYNAGYEQALEDIITKISIIKK